MKNCWYELWVETKRIRSQIQEAYKALWGKELGYSGGLRVGPLLLIEESQWS